MEEDLEPKDDPDTFGPGPGLAPSSADACSALLGHARQVRSAASAATDGEDLSELAVG
jgi:hypothetical protein